MAHGAFDFVNAQPMRTATTDPQATLTEARLSPRILITQSLPFLELRSPLPTQLFLVLLDVPIERLSGPHEVFQDDRLIAAEVKSKP